MVGKFDVEVLQASSSDALRMTFRVSAREGPWPSRVGATVSSEGIDFVLEAEAGRSKPRPYLGAAVEELAFTQT